MRSSIGIFTLFIILISSGFGFAQNSFEGTWTGTLKIQTIELDLVFNIKKNGTDYSASMDSPDQGATGIPVKTVLINGDSIQMEIPEIGMVYKGKQTATELIKGSFSQRGQGFDLDLKKGASAQKEISRPQEPKPKFNYKIEDVVFENKVAQVKLSGTLTLPHGKGPFPTIVLVSGSGPQDRDETIFGHKPFWVLADYFTQKGYAVLRYDDRGTGKSTGDFDKATTVDFAQDALAAVHYLQTRKDIQKKKIGIIGHSEGGAIATMLAANEKGIGFVVMLAGPGLSGDQILLQQQELIAKGSGTPDSIIQKTLATNKQIFDVMRSTKDTATIRERVVLYLNHAYKDGLLPHVEGQTKESIVAAYCSELLTPWLINFVQYDPQPDLQKIKIPALALIGAKDHQVLAKYNIPALQSAFEKSGNTKAKAMELENLNHLFQEATTGMPQEYGNIEQTFSPAAMQIILDWLNLNVK